MLTSKDVAGIPLFSGLPTPELERLARVSADLHLSPGEFAVHERGEGALFAVIEGSIEVVKAIDGIERRLGWRLPGSIFGEVPIALGTRFPGGYRAAGPSRVMRVELQDYYVVAAASPGIAKQIAALARERLGGLQDIAAEPKKPRATVVGHRWDPATSDLRRFLSRNQVSFTWLTPDAPEAEPLISSLPRAAQDGPVVQLTDGQVIEQPNIRNMARRLGIRTEPARDEYDVAVIGGGPAGLAAAVYGASEGLRTIVVEREAPGGQAGTSSRIENYLGFPSGISGDELASRALQQARRLGAEIIVTRSVSGIDPASHEVLLDGGDRVIARSLILATGVSWRRLGVDGFDRLIGRGIYYGAARSEAHSTHGLDIYLVGAGNSAGQAALHFAGHASTVTLVVRGDALERSMSHYLIEQLGKKPNIRVRLRSEIKAVHGDANLQAIDILDKSTGAVSRHDCGAVFIFIGADAETLWLPAQIARDARGYILTGDEAKKAGEWPELRDPYLLETTAAGVFACGDVRLSPVKRVASAVGEGSMAIAFVHQFLAQA